tara:strand:+ start:7430 stop:8038 length:609 start_codon:yes stop_codon:yes gene_type:complete
MEGNPEEDKSGRKIDVRTLPDSVSHLWEAMLRQNPNWDLAKWLEERATEELELLESHLGRERLRYEQRLHRIENLAKQMKRRREGSGGTAISDPNQRNLFDVYGPTKNEVSKGSTDVEGADPLVDFGILGADDDPLLAYVSQKILISIEDANVVGKGMHFDDIIGLLESSVISAEDVDESISWLLQRKEIIEIERDVFVIGG